MTHRLYYTNAYLRDFDASVDDRNTDSTRIYLDRTVFYPTSGGQPYDTGELNSIRVADVVDEGHRIAHILEAPLLDERVTGRIDWSRRFDHMQQHTGQHLLSAVIAELLGRSTLSVHFGKHTATVDLDGGALSGAEMVQVEARANEVVTENRPVEVAFEEAGQAETLRKPSDRTGSLRIVAIRDLDRSACGGTHVRATGEIGAILVRKQERVRTGTRLEFVCGGRAIRQARGDWGILARLAAELTAAPAELPDLIQTQRRDLKALHTQAQALQSEIDRRRAEELYSRATPDARGVRRIVVRDDAGPLERVKSLGQAVASLPRVVFVGAVSQPAGLVLSASEDSGVHAGRVLKQVVAAAGGRGGGSAVLAQGTVSDAAQLERVVESLLRPEE